MQYKQQSNWNTCIVITIFLAVFLSACNSNGSTGSSTGSNTQLQQHSINMLNSVKSTQNIPTSQMILGSTIGNQQSFKVFQVTDSVIIESETITLYSDNACSTISQTAVFTGPAIYSWESGTIHTTDQSLYYTCESMFTGGCASEVTTINSVQFSYTMSNGQTTTMPCMTNDRIADYSTTPASACTSTSQCGFSNTYQTYTLFPAFAWIGGESIVSTGGTYGTQGTPSSSNIPGARDSSISWVGNTGNFWLFGGEGYDANGSQGYLNDLWQYNPTSNQWTWVSGGNSINGNGVYGTQGTPSNSNIPGARYSSMSWTDSTGNLWLFGGHGYDVNGSNDFLNDLWKNDPTSNQWTWVSGESTVNATGIYGTQGTPSSANMPGARVFAATWVDSTGNLWLFGGEGYDTNGSRGYLNDLWQYNPNTNEWTWVTGENIVNGRGIYGTQGTPSSSNTPGARWGTNSWTDNAGNLWLFGGLGYDANGSQGFLNDLWQYNPTSNQWTWMNGPDTTSSSGIYGTQGTPNNINLPAPRIVSISWVDNSGNLWLLGGYGLQGGSGGLFNDLWQYNLNTNEWTWASGTNTPYGGANYGTQNIASNSNIVGARNTSISWVDSSGSLWLFGGQAVNATGGVNDLNDLWKINLGN